MTDVPQTPSISNLTPSLQTVANWVLQLPAGVKWLGTLLVAVAGLATTVRETGWFQSAPAAPQSQVVTLPPPIEGNAYIAVRPFLNLSSDGETDGTVSVGMAMAIDDALFGPGKLRVLARSVSSQLEGQSANVIDIGNRLQLSYLIEGSIQRENKRALVSVDLTKISDGLRLWSETYDLEFDNNVSLQNRVAGDIAEAIFQTLHLPLTPKLLRRNHPIDEVSYGLFQDAQTLLRDRHIDEAIATLKKVVGNDGAKTFAPAWELLAQAYRLNTTYDPMVRSGSPDDAARLVKTYMQEASNAATEAVHLNPLSASGHAMLAAFDAQSGDWTDAEDHGKKALEQGPNEPNVLHDFSQILTITGHLKEALSQRMRLQELDSVTPGFNLVTADVMQINGRRDDAIRLLEKIPADGTQSYFRNVFLARAYAADSRFEDAANTLLQIKGNQVSRKSVEDAANLLRAGSKQGIPAAQLPELQGELNFVYLYVGAADRVLDNPRRYVKQRNMATAGMRALWLPEYAPLRKTEAFKTLVKDANLVQYWLARGWPDLCHPQGADDFVCD
jgi:TolB-like protein